MIIGGLEKFSLIDYPEHLAAIIFTQGCNFRCHFCYNPMLVVPSSSQVGHSFGSSVENDDKIQNNRSKRIDEKCYPQLIADPSEKEEEQLTEDSLFLFLKNRIGKLDAVVISGGEPTLHPDLPVFIHKIKELGFKVKLDSNGTNPEMLKVLLEKELLNYIAMDIKAPPDRYDMVTGTQPDLNKIRESIKIIIESDLPYEFRTTIVPMLHKRKDIRAMGELIKGADKWYLQKFESATDLVNKSFEGQGSFSDDEFEKMLEEAQKYVNFCDFR